MEEPVNEITGAIVSIITVLVTEAELPAVSKTEYTIVYVPAVEVSTEPAAVIEEVIFPSTLSVAVAPGFVNVAPRLRLIVEEPVNVITGAVVSGGVFITTILVTEAELPSLSETEYTIVYVPANEVSTEPAAVIEEVIFPSTSSVAVAPGSVNVAPV